jgi:hypothetical protein
MYYCLLLSSPHFISNRKISNSVSFFSIRDSYGTTQLVANATVSQKSSSVLKALADTPVESVVLVHGTVRKRPLNAQRQSVSQRYSQFNSIQFLSVLFPLILFCRVHLYTLFSLSLNTPALTSPLPELLWRGSQSSLLLEAHAHTLTPLFLFSLYTIRKRERDPSRV